MSAQAFSTQDSKKRKRTNNTTSPYVEKETIPNTNEDYTSEILLLENKILESQKNLNSIITLLQLLDDDDINGKMIPAAVALCRVFCRLMAAGKFTKTKESSGNDQVIIQWLSERLGDFKQKMTLWIKDVDVAKQSTAMILLMQTSREEVRRLNQPAQTVRLQGTFSNLLTALLYHPSAISACHDFVVKYANVHDDMRYFTYKEIGDHLSKQASGNVVQNALSVLLTIEPVGAEPDDFPNCFFKLPTNAKEGRDFYSRNASIKQAQRAWTGILSQLLSQNQKKQILENMSSCVAPCFSKPEILMDFLTKSFDTGGSMSLMALSGLFHLMQCKNLDYPQFYQKLYSLLDENILHSKYRSRFFRLLDTFLGSTHLPAALVASFIKRLSRLSLRAPPSGIVIVVPLIYNLLKSHPSCTFMIHRTPEILEKEERGWVDSFRMEELDPMETDAIDSSLWEIEALQSHYHPNVATIAKIISEQFTKHAYNLEDFLDHSYATMLDGELIKIIKKDPEIEYEIPKKIFGKHDAESGKQDSMLVKLWSFS